MATRESLQVTLERLLGSRNVYYNPPATIEMKYDAIRYSLGSPRTNYASNNKHIKMNCYNLIVISRRPDPEVIQKILELPYSSMGGTPYTAENLHHYPITLYW